MNDLIKEYFYDGIRRIIPGSLLIALYFDKFVDPNSGVLWGSSIVLWLCLLGLAWCLGVAIENVPYAPLVISKAACKWCKDWKRLPTRLQNWSLKLYGWLCWLLCDETDSVPGPTQIELWRLYQKIGAERVMYRSLGVIAVATICCAPALPATLVQAKIAWSRWYGVIGLVLALLFYLCARINHARQVPPHHRISAASEPAEKG